MLAQQALTTQAISGGRLALGIGLSHQLVIEGMFGLLVRKPLRHMREYLDILVPLVRDGTVVEQRRDAHRPRRARRQGCEPLPDPARRARAEDARARRLGRRRHGHVDDRARRRSNRTSCPSSTRRPSAPGDPPPRVGVGLPVCVTDDTTRRASGRRSIFQIYGTLPSYRAMLDREGADGPADVAIIGDEDHGARTGRASRRDRRDRLRGQRIRILGGTGPHPGDAAITRLRDRGPGGREMHV